VPIENCNLKNWFSIFTEYFGEIRTVPETSAVSESGAKAGFADNVSLFILLRKRSNLPDIRKRRLRMPPILLVEGKTLKISFTLVLCAC
jgi:hypothetical protein